MPSISRDSGQTGLKSASGMTGVLAPTGLPTPPPMRESPPRPRAGLSTRVGRYLPRMAVHNVWMVVLLVVMVGKAGEWVPLISGLPVLKITFVLAAIYFNRVSVWYAPVEVMSLPLGRLAIALFTLALLSN